MVAATLLRRSSNSVPFPILVSYPPTPKSFPCHTSENLPLSPTIATLPKTDLSNPSICHTSETPWGRGPSPALRLSSRTGSRDPQASLIPRVTSYEISRRPSPFFSAAYKMLFAQLPCLDKDPSFMGGVPRGVPWGVPRGVPAPDSKGEGRRLLVDVVLRFEPLQQGLEKWLRRIWCPADRYRHFLRGIREISRVRRNSRQRQVADPVIRILFRNLRIELERALGVPRSLQAAGVRVQLNRAGSIERRGKHLGRFLFSPQGIENARFGLQIFKALFILDRGVFPLQRFFQVVIVVQAPLRRLVVSAPGESADISQLVLDALEHYRFHVHGNAEGNRQLLPPKRRSRRIRLHIIENIRQHLRGFCRVRFHAHAQRILFLVVAEAAPGSRVLGKNHRPLIFVREGVQPIRARRKGFQIGRA